MNNDFFERLYKGYAAEHHVSSELFRRRFEVFRLPADFGLDLVVTNQFRGSKEAEDTTNFPFALQVKSRWLCKEQLTDGPNGRLEAVVDFKLKKTECDLLSTTSNSGAVFVFYWPVSSGVEFFPYFFWLHSRHIPFLIQKDYLREDGDSRFLTIRYRQMPRKRPKELISELQKVCDVPPEVEAMLKKELPPAFRRNWEASPYLDFARNDRRKYITNPSLVWKNPSNVQMDFSNFPHFVQIGVD